MDITIEKVTDLNELAQFISELNKQKTSHIGYCGEKVEDIYQTLLEDFVCESDFLVARNYFGEMIGAIGLDIEGKSAEVWGPFNKNPSLAPQQQLWTRLINEHPTIQNFSFFINKENEVQQLFMNELKARKTGEHLILKMKEDDFDRVSEASSRSFIQSDFQAFEKLHNEAFPNTYYNGKTIVERLSNQCVLKVLKSEANELQGYAYFEGDHEMGEASLEYITIHPKYQNQGLGTMLLKEVLTEIFSHDQIKEIRLCVDNLNVQANHLYMKVGFKPIDILYSYNLKR